MIVWWSCWREDARGWGTPACRGHSACAAVARRAWLGSAPTHEGGGGFRLFLVSPVRLPESPIRDVSESVPPLALESTRVLWIFTPLSIVTRLVDSSRDHSEEKNLDVRFLKNRFALVERCALAWRRPVRANASRRAASRSRAAPRRALCAAAWPRWPDTVRRRGSSPRRPTLEPRPAL